MYTHIHTHIHVFVRVLCKCNSQVFTISECSDLENSKKKEPEKRKEPCHPQRLIITMPSAPPRAFAGAVPFSALLHSFCMHL